ncbi:MAG: ABC transporter ATP-binding protein [Acidobacteriota bacterium]
MSTRRQSNPGIVVEGLSHCFGTSQVLDDISLTVGRGEVCCLLGPSGCGKSTLLRLVAGLEKLQKGRIAIAGKEVASQDSRVPPEKRSIGFVFQDYALFPHLNVRANIAFGIISKTQAERVDRLLEQVDMTDYADAMPHTLSGGQQQRVALARALAPGPMAMLLDEPFSGLDAQLREEVRNVTLDVLRQANVATLMVTHDPHEALVVGNQVIVMATGRVLQMGTPMTVYNHSASLRIAETFGPVNRLNGVVHSGLAVTALGVFQAPTYLSEGAAATVALRPETIRIVPPHDEHVQATVETVTHEGTTICLTVRLPDDTTLVIRDLARQRVTEGEIVHLVVDDHAAMVFERDGHNQATKGVTTSLPPAAVPPYDPESASRTRLR